jgi:proteic killer suppression protein
MDVEFADSDLAKVETEEAAQTRLPVAVIKAARRKLTVLRAAPDERALRNWKSLHYEKLKGDRAGQRSIRLNDQWRMVFTLEETAQQPKIIVIAIEDYH